MGLCTSCMYVDSTKENDAICRECNDGSEFVPAPYVMRHESDNIDALIEGLKVIRETCKTYYDERIGCTNCPLRSSVDNDSCELGLFKPSGWLLKSDEEQDNRLFK